MPIKRHRVKLRKSYVRYRFKTAAQATWTWSRRLTFVALGVWAAQAGHRFWSQTPYLRVKAVQGAADVPAALLTETTVRAGDHLFRFSTRAIERHLQQRYPEFSRVSVRRRPDGRVAVAVDRRVPVARVADGENWRGMAEDGVTFPLDETRFPREPLPVLAVPGEGEAARPALAFLKLISSQDAAWVKELRKLKAEPDGEATLFLRADLPVHWGSMAESPKVVRRKAQRLERVLNDDSLAEGAAHLRFIDEDRVAVKPLTAELLKKTADDNKNGPERP
ncbi:MAG TPA: cell division protein FtsQ/DivIB [Elusimicrobiota bacterium]|nr:cell division protein FtsQ/DivIB [Elusimicrobiota bacterium]